MTLFKKYLYHLSRLITVPLFPPELLIISLTECCNLKCITCNIRKDIAKEGLVIDTQKILSIIEQAKKMGIGIIVLSGGEPFLADEIFQVIRFIRESNLTVSVTTNGFWAEQLADKIAHSGVSHLHFSFDGLAKHHDEIRGNGSYETMIRNICLIRRINPSQSMGFGTVVCSINCNDLFEMTKVADGLRINTMNFIPYLVSNIDPQHSSKGCEYSKLWPNNQDLINLKNNFSQILSHRYKYLRVNFNPNFKLLFDYYAVKKIDKKCFAGYKSMIITSQRKINDERMASDVFFCQDSCGNVYNMSLKEAWYSKKAKQMRIIARKCNNSCLQFCHYI